MALTERIPSDEEKHVERLFASAVLLLTAAAGITQAASKLNVMTATQDLARWPAKWAAI